MYTMVVFIYLDMDLWRVLKIFKENMNEQTDD